VFAAFSSGCIGLTALGVSRYYPGGRSSHFLPLKNTGYPV
jgi:hypothetical protein